MNWGFVDYENIGSLKDVKFTDYQRLFVFCGPKNPNIKLGNATINEFIKIEIIKLKTSGSNNLDFHIFYYLGKFGVTAPKDICFHVISRDNGFDGILNHIKKSGRACKKITLISDKEKAANIKLSPCAELTVERLAQIDGRKRPRKEQQLVNWIESQCRPISKKLNGKAIVGELAKAGLVNKENPVLKYQLKR